MAHTNVTGTYVVGAGGIRVADGRVRNAEAAVTPHPTRIAGTGLGAMQLPNWHEEQMGMQPLLPRPFPLKIINS